MAFDELKKDLKEADDDIRSYLENSEAYYKLRIFKALMRAVTSFTHVIVVGAIAFLAIFLLSLALAYSIGNALESTYIGLAIVGGFYVIVAILCYVFRKRFDRPLFRKFSKYYFE
ncbi:hypothetical protein HPE56_09160 [Maribacter sp. ANRC-HE7]|uniref:Holin-X, holin superfamily III n=1 Tax=Maribacter aquimaris TaxID=2737171 RepID=A0ABR7V455_9FLAO|nr:hypothetical protein [Maribacter aquimaris]MBD0777962.1 hypothetical protein [Maribacter aquimaris]